MEIDNFEFEKLSDTNISDYFGAVGVYILWDSQAKKVPSYIGEGGIFKRFSDHEKNFAHPIDGYVAFGGRISDGIKSYKKESELLEAVLLHISERIGKEPKHNRQKNYTTPIKKYFKSNRVLKFEIEGFDPFCHPDEKEKVRSKEIYLERIQNKIHLTKHPWKKLADPAFGSILFDLDE